MPEFLKKTSTANILIIAAIIGLVIYAATRKTDNKQTQADGKTAATETGTGETAA